MKNLVLAISALTIAATAQAQTTKDTAMASAEGKTVLGTAPSGGVTITAAGGAAFPISDLKDADFKTGYSGLAGLGFNVPQIPFALRAEVGYNHFGHDVADTHINVLTLGLNGILQAPTQIASVVPYLTAGVGFGHVKGEASVTSTATPPVTTTVSNSENKFMYNAGVGLKGSLTRVDIFVEARFTSVLTEGSSTNFIPLLVGVTFRP